MNNRFEGKTVVITGAATGIGRESALLFAREGARLVLADINQELGEQTAMEIIEDTGVRAIFIKTDVTDKEQVEQLFASAVKEFGSIDIGVNNAGIGGPFGPLEQISGQDYSKLISVNLGGVFYCMQEELKLMKKQKSGVIVNTASMAGLRGSAYSSVYVASKHAVVGLTKSAALENARFNIRINAVCPAFTMTNMVKEQLLSVDPSYEEKLKKALPMRRYGTTKEIADAIAFLSSDAASFNTGLCLPVDGGLCA